MMPAVRRKPAILFRPASRYDAPVETTITLGPNVKALLWYFLDLCRLRATPQQLPASRALLLLVAGLSLLAGVLLLQVARVDATTAVLESGVDLGLMLGVLFVSLGALRRGSRFLQTATALLGSGALFALLAIPLQAMLPVDTAAADSSGLSGVLLVALVIWNMLVYGHILRHAFDVQLGFAVGLAVLYSLFSFLAMTQLFPMA